MTKVKVIRPFNTDKIARYVWIGRNDLLWYSDAERLFAELFGSDKVRTVARLFAATSINTSLKANITLFRRALHEIDNDLPIGKYLPNIKIQLERIREGKELSGRKINSFANAMSGDKNAVVVDVWLLRAFNEDRKYYRKGSDTYRSGGASEKQYDIIESFVRSEAKAMSIEPRQLSAMIWSGVRIDQGGDRETRYESLLRYQFINMFSRL